jgi:alkanesulfonate monooxygenase SsuD/methylene tetrahydromethanopterin reductase-like flavin-dependent oxidoreductase (luciferase family)
VLGQQHDGTRADGQEVGVSDANARPPAPSRRHPADTPPHFGLYLPQVQMSYGAIEEKVRHAEALGFHSVWLMDHLAPPAAPQHDALEALALTAALAARTTNIRLGQLTLNASLRHPALLAKQVATLDQISGGRVELGLGWGSVPAELVTYGYGREPALERARRLVETIEITRLMFSGERFDYDGTHHTLVDAIGRPRPQVRRLVELPHLRGRSAVFADPAAGALHPHLRAARHRPGADAVAARRRPGGGREALRHLGRPDHRDRT